MFRLQNNVPEVYPEKSRDFQIFCRLFDASFNSVKQSIDSMELITDTMACDSVLLPLLKDKLGFYSSLDLGDKELRYILDAFPVLMRYKGSQRAIDYVTNLYSRIVSSISTSAPIQVNVENNNYVIEVSSTQAVVRSDLLFELLNYILPTGYLIDYYVTMYQNAESGFYAENTIVYSGDFLLSFVSNGDVEASYLQEEEDGNFVRIPLFLQENSKGNLVYISSDGIPYYPHPINISGAIYLSESEPKNTITVDGIIPDAKLHKVYKDDETFELLFTKYVEYEDEEGKPKSKYVDLPIVYYKDPYGGYSIKVLTYEEFDKFQKNDAETTENYFNLWKINAGKFYPADNDSIFLGVKSSTANVVISPQLNSEFQELPKIVNTFYIHK